MIGKSKTISKMHRLFPLFSLLRLCHTHPYACTHMHTHAHTHCMPKHSGCTCKMKIRLYFMFFLSSHCHLAKEECAIVPVKCTDIIVEAWWLNAEINTSPASKWQKVWSVPHYIFCKQEHHNTSLLCWWILAALMVGFGHMYSRVVLLGMYVVKNLSVGFNFHFFMQW